jgi:glycosyltransferase involved in cell wall biosynthesis
MKILHVVPAFYPSPAYGGPTEAVYRLCQLLAEQEHDVRVLTTDANGLSEVIPVDREREVELAKALRVRYCARRFRHSVSPTLVRLLPTYVRWAEVVHVSGVYSFPTIPTLVACRTLQKPVVWSPHGALQRWQQSRRVVGKKIFELACKAVMPRTVVCHVASAEEGDHCHRVGSVDVAVLPHGVDIPPVPAPQGSSDGTLRMLSLGRLDPIKGIENLLTACRMLLDTSALQWSLRIVGGGDVQYVRLLDEKVRSLGLAGRVAMTGAVSGEAKKRVFDAVDLVVVPSHRESFGLVVAEALAHGVPVVVSTGTPWKAIEAERCGLFVSNSPEALAGAIERIQKMALREMGLRGRDWMAREFSWQAVAERMADLYRGLETQVRARRAGSGATVTAVTIPEQP